MAQSGTDVRYVTTELREGVLTVTLNDPERRNALNATMVTALSSVLSDAEAGVDVGAVVVVGAGSAFCAGADLGHLRGADRQGMLHIYQGFLKLAASPLFTVAAVNGAAVGAGLNLALAADVRLAGRSARFDCRFLTLGVHPGGGHGYMLERAVGPQAAAAMVLGGQVLDGPEAERIGLAWRCVDDDALLAEATALARRGAGCPRELARRAKATLRSSPTLPSHAAAVELELEEQLWSLGQQEFAERLEAASDRTQRRDAD